MSSTLPHSRRDHYRDTTGETGLFWFLADDSGFAWVRGDVTRGQAIAQTAAHFEVPFVQCRARRVYGHWRHLELLAGWEFDDGTLAGCEKGDRDAQPFWEVTTR